MSAGRNKVAGLAEAAQAAIDAWTEEGSYSEIATPKLDKAMRALFVAVNRAAAEPEAKEEISANEGQCLMCGRVVDKCDMPNGWCTACCFPGTP